MKLAIYDFDGTIFMKETLPFLVKYYGRKPYSRWYYIRFYLQMVGLLLRYKLPLDRDMDKEKFRATAAACFMGLFQGLKKKEIQAFFRDSAGEMTGHLNARVVEDMRVKKREGYHVVICSGANTLLLKEMAAYLTVDTVLGTELSFHEDGRYNDREPLFVTTGVNKPVALLGHFDKSSIDWENSLAYGDSYYDVDILTLTGNPVAVKPDDRLREIAEAKGWPIWT